VESDYQLHSIRRPFVDLAASVSHPFISELIPRPHHQHDQMPPEDPELAQGRSTSKVRPLSPKEIVSRLDSSNRQKFLFEYEKRARDQSTKWQSVWEAHLLVLTILREIASIPTLSPYPFVAVCRWEPAKEMILGEGEGEFKLVLCDEVGAHFCVVSSRIVNAEFYTEKNRQIYADLQREILQAKVYLLSLRNY
jgi:hypothetical protein